MFAESRVPPCSTEHVVLEFVDHLGLYTERVDDDLLPSNSMKLNPRRRRRTVLLASLDPDVLPFDLVGEARGVVIAERDHPPFPKAPISATTMVDDERVPIPAGVAVV